MPVFADGFAAGEAEFLLRIGAAPPAGKTAFTLDEAAELIDAVHVGIEIASSPLRGDQRARPDRGTISDFGNNNGLVIGAGDRRTGARAASSDWEVETCWSTASRRARAAPPRSPTGRSARRASCSS